MSCNDIYIQYIENVNLFDMETFLYCDLLGDNSPGMCSVCKIYTE